jgi:hypothetical protein
VGLAGPPPPRGSKRVPLDGRTMEPRPREVSRCRRRPSQRAAREKRSESKQDENSNREPAKTPHGATLIHVPAGSARQTAGNRAATMRRRKGG